MDHLNCQSEKLLQLRMLKSCLKIFLFFLVLFDHAYFRKFMSQYIVIAQLLLNLLMSITIKNMTYDKNDTLSKY
jgi:hypothetical protein